MKDVLFEAQGGQFLAPHSVGSSVSWYVSVTGFTYSHGTNKGKKSSRLAAGVYISDCERKITWGFYDAEDVEKLDKAIAELNKMRDALVSGLLIEKANSIPKADDDDDL